MYNIAMRNNTVWGIDGYKVPAEYLDSRKLQEIHSGKFTKPAPRALKMPDYLTDTLRYAKTPAPNAYNIVKPWVDDKKKTQQPKPTKKNSYIDNIIFEINKDLNLALVLIISEKLMNKSKRNKKAKELLKEVKELISFVKWNIYLMLFLVQATTILEKFNQR